MCSTDNFLNNWGYKLLEKKELLKLLNENIHKEFNMNSSKSLLQLDKMYRTERPNINNLISHIPNKWNSLFAKRMLEQQEALTKIIKITSSSNLLLSDILHMNINRIFKSRNKICELVIYHFLAKYYKSEIAKLSPK